MKSKRQPDLPPITGFSEFSEHVLGNKLYPKQREILDAMNPYGSQVSVASGNETGKTSVIIPSVILGAMVLHRAKVASTAGAFRQIEAQLTPKLKSYSTLFPSFRFLDNKIATKEPLCFWTGFATDDAGKFEGFHGEQDHPLLIVIDEAKTVKNEIFQAVERCKPTWLLLMSSTGYAQGEFYASHTTKANFFKRFKITADDCPHWTEEAKKRVRDKWGADHPLVKSMLDAEFMEFVKGAVVNLAALDDILAAPPAFIPGERKARCDFAWSETGSGDENVLALRNGNKITLEACFRENGIHAVCGRFIYEFLRLGLKPWEIEGDGDGKGAQIIEMMAQMGWPITPAYNGGKPIWNDRYQDRASEEWGEGNLAIIKRQFILPMDVDLYGQMLDRRIVQGRTGLFAIESKKSMSDPNREGGAVRCSPDRADAVFGAMMKTNALVSTNLIEQRRDYSQLPEWARPAELGQAVEDEGGVRRYFG